MKHKHSETIKAFADGIQCEYWSHELKKWCYVTQLETFDWADTVRIKPEPKQEQEQEPQHLFVYKEIHTNKAWMSTTPVREAYERIYLGKVEVKK